MQGQIYAKVFYTILPLMGCPFCQCVNVRYITNSFDLEARQGFVINLLKLVQFLILLEILFLVLHTSLSFPAHQNLTGYLCDNKYCCTSLLSCILGISILSFVVCFRTAARTLIGP